MDRPDIDRLIDWPQFYAQYIQTPIKPAGQDKMHCCCPFHEESHPSFWFNTKNGMFKCEAGCGSGNATAFLARVKSITTGEAHKELCNLAGVPLEAKKPRTVDSYTVREYALEKRLPEDWLRGIGVTDGGKDRMGGYIRIAYRDEQGAATYIRKRYSPVSTQRFAWQRGSKATLYGLWQLQSARTAGYAVLVEGESDAQTLWHLGISALGVPGASSFQQAWADKLTGIKTVYIHVEPDQGGEGFLQKTASGLLRGKYSGEVKSFSCAAREGCKDPSQLYLQEEDGAAALILDMLRKAEPVDLERVAKRTTTGLNGAPITLNMPNGWRVTDSGIEEYTAQNGQWRRVSWTPLLLTRTLPSKGVGDIKVELSFLRTGGWHTVRVERGVLASSRRIVELSEHGINVTSENAKDIVRYLSDLEFANISDIPEVPRITHYGWIDESHFAPGLCDGYYLDSDHVTGNWAKVGAPKGDYDTWKRTIGAHRDRALYRFILAAAFAAPLLKPLGQRIFMIYNWGGSLGGKTAALYCALSVWGDPEFLKVTFNATQAGFERVASFYSDLPLGINEKQVAGDKQEYLQKIVYMLAEGSGRLRSNKAGGLQTQATWRSIILANGEEPLSVASTMTGIATRVLELYGGPFPDKLSASEMYRITDMHHGHAGVDFVRRLAALPEGELSRRYDEMRAALQRHATEHSISYAMSVATVAVADYYASLWIWGHCHQDAWTAAVGMAREILSMLQSAEEGDVNERAYRHLIDWVVAGRRQFTDHYQLQRYGWLECEEGMNGAPGKAHHVLIIPSRFDEEMTRAKFSPKKTLQWLAEQGYTDTEIWSGKVRLTVRRQRDGVRSTFIRLALPSDVDIDGFTVVDDAELPFADGAP